MSPPSPEELKEAFQKYLKAGVCPIPIVPYDKFVGKAALKRSGHTSRFGSTQRKRLEAEPPSLKDLERWLDSDDPINLGLTLFRRGPYVLDFDQASIFHAWAEDHTELVSSTPVQRTPRGFHVWLTGRYFSRFEHFRNLSLAFCIPGSTEKAGQVLNGPQGYVIAWPSRYPDGRSYEWLPGQAPWDLPPARIEHLEDAGLELHASCTGGFPAYAKEILRSPKSIRRRLRRKIKTMRNT